jgi:hypothetical protein
MSNYKKLKSLNIRSKFNLLRKLNSLPKKQNSIYNLIQPEDL